MQRVDQPAAAPAPSSELERRPFIIPIRCLYARSRGARPLPGERTRQLELSRQLARGIAAADYGRREVARREDLRPREGGDEDTLVWNAKFSVLTSQYFPKSVVDTMSSVLCESFLFSCRLATSKTLHCTCACLLSDPAISAQGTTLLRDRYVQQVRLKQSPKSPASLCRSQYV